MLIEEITDNYLASNAILNQLTMFIQVSADSYLKARPVKIFYRKSLEESFKEVNPMEWEKIFANYVHTRGQPLKYIRNNCNSIPKIYIQKPN